MYQEHNIQSIPDLLGKLETLFESNNTIWFRGHPENEEYRLGPSIHRGVFSPENEKILMDMFKSKAVPYLDHQPQTYWEWLFLMQHHSVPTRLLDWTESALIGLAFAVQERNEKHIGKGAALWCLKPNELNNKLPFRSMKDSNFIPNINENDIVDNSYNIEAEVTPQYPVAIIGPQNSKRIIAQKGVFTLFPSRGKVMMEDMDGNGDFLIKFNIEEKHVEPIAEQLYKLGITESSLYPDLVSVAKEISKEFKALQEGGDV